MQPLWKKNKHISPHHTPPSPGAQHLQGYAALNRSEMVYLRKCKTGFCAITTTQGRLCSLTIQAIYSQPATMQAQGLSSAGVQWHLSDLSTIGCRAWEASLSNILWSGGCREWSSSARAALHLCRSRAWSPASHMTCWFRSVCTRDCRILATASWRSSACWKKGKSIFKLRGHKQIWEDTNREDK